MAVSANLPREIHIENAYEILGAARDHSHVQAIWAFRIRIRKSWVTPGSQHRDPPRRAAVRQCCDIQGLVNTGYLIDPRRARYSHPCEP
jgi:hypothetical protein